MHISFIFLFFDSKPASCQPICGIIIANKSFSSANVTLVCSFRAIGKNRRHLGCRNVVPSKGCAVQNKGITLKIIRLKNTRKWAGIRRSANSIQQVRKWRAYCDPCTTTFFMSVDRHQHGWPPRLEFWLQLFKSTSKKTSSVGYKIEAPIFPFTTGEISP